MKDQIRQVVYPSMALRGGGWELQEGGRGMCHGSWSQHQKALKHEGLQEEGHPYGAAPTPGSHPASVCEGKTPLCCTALELQSC